MYFTFYVIAGSRAELHSMYRTREPGRDGGLHLVVAGGPGARARRGAAHTARRSCEARARPALIDLPVGPLAAGRPLPVGACAHHHYYHHHCSDKGGDHNGSIF